MKMFARKEGGRYHLSAYGMDASDLRKISRLSGIADVVWVDFLSGNSCPHRLSFVNEKYISLNPSKDTFIPGMFYHFHGIYPPGGRKSDVHIEHSGSAYVVHSAAAPADEFSSVRDYVAGAIGGRVLFSGERGKWVKQRTRKSQRIGLERAPTLENIADFLDGGTSPERIDENSSGKHYLGERFGNLGVPFVDFRKLPEPVYEKIRPSIAAYLTDDEGEFSDFLNRKISFL